MQNKLISINATNLSAKISGALNQYFLNFYYSMFMKNKKTLTQSSL